MARGKLRCIGKAAELKRRFGAGFTFTVSIDSSGSGGSGGSGGRTLSARQNDIHQYIMSLFPSAKLLAEPIAGTAQYEVSRSDVVLSDVFSQMEDQAILEQYQITDWAITETTLDECFLKVTKRVHAEEDGLVNRMGRSLSTACLDQQEIF